MKTILAMMGILVAAFLLTTTLEGAYALTQTITQKSVQVQDNDQKVNNQAGLANKGNENYQSAKTNQKADNDADCKYSDCDTHVKVIKAKDNRKWDSHNTN